MSMPVDGYVYDESSAGCPVCHIEEKQIERIDINIKPDSEHDNQCEVSENNNNFSD